MARLTFDGKQFIWEGTYHDRHLPKEAGFRWDSLRRVWWTDDAEKAFRLREYADRRALERLAVVEERASLSRSSTAEIEVPAPPGREYLPYQKAGIAFLDKTPSALLADEMGLGKTIQVLGLINRHPEIQSILVVCPASLRLNWEREARRWLTREIPITVLHSQSKWSNEFAKGMVIVHYDILDRFPLSSFTWDLVVVDEAHYIKNMKAKRTQLTRSLRGQRKVLLTGTPIVNRPAELYSLISYLDKKRWPSFWKFAQRYCAPKHNGFGWDFSGASNLDELQDILRKTVMIRRLKKDVLSELPPKTRQIIELPANGASSAIMAERRKVEEHAERLAALRAAVELAKTAENDEEYRQAVANLRKAASVAFAEISECRHQTALAKVPYVIDHVRDLLESEDKVVVFAHHKDVIRQIFDAFPGQAVMITGDTALDKRQEAVDRFQSDPSVRLMVASILAAGVGITLTAARVAVFAELDWVPGNITQAEDRLHRVGQRDNVLVQHLVLEGSIDARLAQVIVQKQSVIKAALDEQEEVESEGEESYLDAALFPTSQPTPKARIEELAAKLTDRQIQAAHEAVKILAALDVDRASKVNEVGFNKVDSAIGHSLANLPSLTKKQAALAALLAHRYRKQLPETLLSALAEVS